MKEAFSEKESEKTIGYRELKKVLGEFFCRLKE